MNGIKHLSHETKCQYSLDATLHAGQSFCQGKRTVANNPNPDVTPSLPRYDEI